MPNGGDKNWVRFCLTVDGFRQKHGSWPTRVRVTPGTFADLVGHVLTPVGFALVSSIVEVIAEDDASFVAEGERGRKYDYGKSGASQGIEPSTRDWFGSAVLRPDLD